METMNQMSSEWTARELRPVARWVPEIAADGRSILVMRWSVPEVAITAIVHSAAA